MKETVGEEGSVVSSHYVRDDLLAPYRKLSLSIRACTICFPTDLEKRVAGCSWLGLGGWHWDEVQGTGGCSTTPLASSLEKPGAAPLSVTTENISDAGVCLALGGGGWGTAESLPQTITAPRCSPFLTSAAPENHLASFSKLPCLGLGPAWGSWHRLGRNETAVRAVLLIPMGGGC